MNNICPICCEEDILEKVESRSVTVNGRSLTIHDDVFMHCNACGDDFYTDQQASKASRKVNDARRRAEGLLTGEEIKRIRQSLMLSQEELQQALGIGQKTVVRWELGTAVQGKAIDDVLRLIALDPDNFRLLVRLRNAALSQLVQERTLPQDERMSGEIKEAIYSGIEQANVDMTYAERITESIYRALNKHRKERIERYSDRILHSEEIKVA